MTQRILCFLYSKIYKKWLWNDFHKQYDIVLKVKGWRTARTRTRGGTVVTSSPCFKILWIDFD